MEKKIRFFAFGYEELLYMAGDRAESKRVWDEGEDLGNYATEAEAVRAAKDYLAGKENAVNPARRGIGSVTYYSAEIERWIWDEACEGWFTCDADGTPEGEATFRYDHFPICLDTLEGSREKGAWDAARKSYLSFLDYGDGGFDTVRDILALGED